MRDATLYRLQWDGLVAQVRMLGRLEERDGMVSALMPAVPTSSLMNVAIAADPTATPQGLAALSARYRDARVDKWGLWVDADDEDAARAAADQGMILDSRPQAMVATLHKAGRNDTPPP